MVKTGKYNNFGSFLLSSGYKNIEVIGGSTHLQPSVGGSTRDSNAEGTVSPPLTRGKSL